MAQLSFAERLRTGLKGIAPLRRAYHFGRHALNRLACRATRALVLASPGHRIVVVVGMRRCGNHAVINWLLAQAPGPVAFYNNIAPRHHPYTTRQMEFRLRAPRRDAALLVLSYEDAVLEQVLAGPLASVLERHAGTGRPALTVVQILRDPFNLFASRLKKWPERFASDEAIAVQAEVFKAHARLALTPASAGGDVAVVPILYNRFIVDPAYRATLSAELGINAGDAGLDQVPLYGHGSSFDGSQLSGAELRARTRARWRDVEEDPRFKKAVADAELRELSAALFPAGSGYGPN